MKEDLFICDCHSIEHQVVTRFSLEDKEIYMEIHLVKRSFWYRVKYGIKYIFGYKSRFGAWDEFIWKAEDVDRLRELADSLEDISDLNEEKDQEHFL